METREYPSRDINAVGQTANRSALHPLHEAALRLAAKGKPRPNSKARDLVSMLLAHGARAWRSSQPPVAIHLYLTSPNGNKPIRMYLGNTVDQS